MPLFPEYMNLLFARRQARDELEGWQEGIMRASSVGFPCLRHLQYYAQGKMTKISEGTDAIFEFGKDDEPIIRHKLELMGWHICSDDELRALGFTLELVPNCEFQLDSERYQAALSLPFISGHFDFLGLSTVYTDGDLAIIDAKTSMNTPPDNLEKLLQFSPGEPWLAQYAPQQQLYMEVCNRMGIAVRKAFLAFHCLQDRLYYYIEIPYDHKIAMHYIALAKFVVDSTRKGKELPRTEHWQTCLTCGYLSHCLPPMDKVLTSTDPAHITTCKRRDELEELMKPLKQYQSDYKKNNELLKQFRGANELVKVNDVGVTWEIGQDKGGSLTYKRIASGQPNQGDQNGNSTE